MLPSLTPMATRIARSRVKNSAASAADRRSGSVTISISGTPLRLKSRYVRRAESAKPSCSDLPGVLLEVHARDPDRRLAIARSATRSRPCSASGWSYCEIW